jgi:hypothetical protein
VLARSLKEFHNIAIGIFEQDLLAAMSDDNIIAEASAGPLHFCHERHQILNLDGRSDFIRQARDVVRPAWAEPRSFVVLRAERQVLVGDASESRRHALIELEPERLRVEGNGTLNVRDEISDGCHDVRLRLEEKHFVMNHPG